jgi:hypothetical protein
MARMDMVGSFVLDRAPFFPVPAHLLMQIPNQTESSAVLQRWSATFPELSDIASFLFDARIMADYINQNAGQPDLWEDYHFIGRVFHNTVHQLLSLPRHGERLERGEAPQEFLMREAIRLGCLALFSLLRTKFYISPSGLSEHKNKVREFLDRHLIDWSLFPELQIWVLTTAALATRDEETSWYLAEIKFAMSTMRLSQWKEAIPIVKSILWVDAVFTPRGENFGE